MIAAKRMIAAVLSAILLLSSVEPLYVRGYDEADNTVQASQTTQEPRENSEEAETAASPVKSGGLTEENQESIEEFSEPSEGGQGQESPEPSEGGQGQESPEPSEGGQDQESPEPSEGGQDQESSEPSEEASEPADPFAERREQLAAEVEAAVAALPQETENLDAAGCADLKAGLARVDGLLASLAELADGADPWSLLGEEFKAIYEERTQFLAEQLAALRGQLVAELEESIPSSSDLAALQAALDAGSYDRDTYETLKDTCNQIGEKLAALADLTGEAALPQLSEDAQERYAQAQAILLAMEEEIAQPEQIDAIKEAVRALPTLAEGETRLGKDAYIRLKEGLREIDEMLEALKKYLPDAETSDPWTLIDDPGIKEAYEAAVALLDRGPAEPDLTLLPGLEDVRLNEESSSPKLKFIWNDQGNTQRPAGLTEGIGLESADVQVMVSAGGETKTLYQFYYDILREHGGYDEETIRAFVDSAMRPQKSDPIDDPQGSRVEYTWEVGKLLTEYNGQPVSYQLAPVTLEGKDYGKIGSYRTDRKADDPTTVLATPTREFHYSVVWYDNHNTYVDDKGEHPRPSDYSQYIDANAGTELDGHLQVIRISDNKTGSNEILEGADFNPVITEVSNSPNEMGDSWNITLSDLPLYSPSGESYQYWTRQTDQSNGGVLNTSLEPVNGKQAYYKQEIVSSDLLNPKFPNAIPENATVYNILNREGYIKIDKQWADGDNHSRPTATFHFYRQVETEVLHRTDGVLATTFEGAPVSGYDKVTIVPGSLPEGVAASEEDPNLFTITVPGDGATLPMFDAYGRRYIYYCVETMADPGDYESVIDNHTPTAGPVVLQDEYLNAVRGGADAAGIILNGATVTNQLKKQIQIPVEVDFKAQAIQNNMGTASVQLQLQRKDPATGAWKPYSHTRDDGTVYDGTLTLDQFAPEIMSAEGASELVPKYDEESGEIYEYRWVQTAIVYDEGVGTVPEQPDPDSVDADSVHVADKVEVSRPNEDEKEVGPGVDNGGKEENTTLFFQVDSTNPGKPGTQVITNTLVGDTRVRADKAWIVTVGDQTYSTFPKPGSDEILWDGSEAGLKALGVNTEDLDVATWPADIELTFNVLRDGQPLLDSQGGNVTLTMGKGEFVARKDDLNRYDENGNEYSYSLDEVTVGGWVTTWQHTTDVVERDDGVKVLRKTTSFENRVGPGELLVFDVTKYWEDDTDLGTRRDVVVGVFDMKGEKKAEAKLNLLNNWFAQMVIEKDPNVDNDSVDNYVVKEISVGGVEAVCLGSDGELKDRAYAFGAQLGADQNYFQTHRDDRSAFTGYVAETLAMDDSDPGGKLKFQYNVYLSARNNAESGGPAVADRAYYDIYNQRTAVLDVKVTKNWINDGQQSTATFNVYRGRNGVFSETEYGS